MSNVPGHIYHDVYGGNFFMYIILMLVASDKSTLFMQFYSTIPLGKSYIHKFGDEFLKKA